MNKETLVQLGENLGFLMFTLGATGIGVGMIVGMVAAPDDVGQTWLVTFLVTSIALAVVGGVVGSIADAAAPARKRADRQPAPVRPVHAGLSNANAARPLSPAQPDAARRTISAFRAVQKPAQRPTAVHH